MRAPSVPSPELYRPPQMRAQCPPFKQSKPGTSQGGGGSNTQNFFTPMPTSAELLPCFQPLNVSQKNRFTPMPSSAYLTPCSQPLNVFQRQESRVADASEFMSLG